MWWSTFLLVLALVGSFSFVGGRRSAAVPPARERSIVYSRRRSVDKVILQEDAPAAHGDGRLRAFSQELMYQAASLMVSAEARSLLVNACVRHVTVSAIQDGDDNGESRPRAWSKVHDDDDNFDGDGDGGSDGIIGRARQASQEMVERIVGATSAVSSSAARMSRLSRFLPQSIGRWSQRTSFFGNGDALPPAAQSFVGGWKFVRDENCACSRAHVTPCHQQLPAHDPSLSNLVAALVTANCCCCCCTDGAFLGEAQGLPWAMRKCAERIHPTPKFHIEDGKLHCETLCLGAKPVRELLTPGESAFHEPNVSSHRIIEVLPLSSASLTCALTFAFVQLGHDYIVASKWEGATFVATRKSDAVNGGRPTVQRRWVDQKTDELVVSQDWGGKKPFIARYARR